MKRNLVGIALASTLLAVAFSAYADVTVKEP